MLVVRVKKSLSLMSLAEKIILGIVLIVAFSATGVKINNLYVLSTKIAPAPGGQYDELLVGNVKYINPILAQSDAEKAVSSLVFSGLVKIRDGKPVPDLAKGWTVEDEGKKYIFELKDNIFFQDGQPVTVDDIAMTVDTIKSPEYKSGYYALWKDVDVQIIDDKKIAFLLPKSYGPFIFNANFGILPAHLTSEEFNRRQIGSGPYALEKTIQESGKIKEIILKRNETTGRDYYIERIHFVLADSTDKYHDDLAKGNFDAVWGGGNLLANDLSYQSSKRLGLILNTRADALKDREVRRKILAGEQFTDPISLNLVSLDTSPQREMANTLKEKLSGQNVHVNLTLFNNLKMQEALTKRNYDLLLYGFDFGYDRDPYAFWHSSQIDNLNLAGWSDKITDILIEDARMETDQAKRNEQYDQIFKTIEDESLAKFYDPIKFSYSVGSNIKNISKITSGTQPESRFDQLSQWYITEKRVRK